jgi:hypothetical protein
MRRLLDDGQQGFERVIKRQRRDRVQQLVHEL